MAEHKPGRTQALIDRADATTIVTRLLIERMAETSLELRVTQLRTRYIARHPNWLHPRVRSVLDE